MVRLEGFMEIQQLHHDGVSVSEIARRLNMDRKTVRKYLGQAPRAYERKVKSWKGRSVPGVSARAARAGSSERSPAL